MGEQLGERSIGHAAVVTASGVNDVRNVIEVWSQVLDGERAWVGFAVDADAQEALVLHIHNPFAFPLHFLVQWRGNSTREATVQGEAHWPIPNGVRKWIPTSDGFDTDYEGLQVSHGN